VLAPNPASSLVNLYNLNQEENSETNFTFKVYTSLGLLLLSNETTNKATLNVSQWADGIYTILIQNENGVQALKLAVQKGTIAN
jgi:hypothetical protein